MVIQGLNFSTIAILSALILAICYDGIRFADEQRFNDALAAGDEAQVIGQRSAHRQFAKAYALQQQRDFKATVTAYAAIDAASGSQMQMDIKFNLANLYFREASQLREIGADDLAMPLVELAKQNYKELLRINNGHWDAKYNLELALVLAPEMDPVDPLEERNPEHSPRALTKTKLREPLP
jgi:mxaK protein